MPKLPVPPETTLVALGFTEFEAVLYCELLRHGAVTGYRLAQIVAKAPANTYQALKTLAQKGAVVVSESADDARTYGPVPPDQLLASLEVQFDARRKAATDALDDLKAARPNERVFQLQTVSQAVERARAMLSSAKEIALFDFFPPILEMMRDDVEAARARGVLVVGTAYRQADASATVPFNADSSEVISDLWPGLGLIVVSDAAQMLMAQVSRDQLTLLNGVWSDSAFLSATYHSALAAEIRLVAMREDSRDPLRRISLFNARPPGLRKVLQEQV